MGTPGTTGLVGTEPTHAACLAINRPLGRIEAPVLRQRRQKIVAMAAFTIGVTRLWRQCEMDVAQADWRGFGSD